MNDYPEFDLEIVKVEKKANQDKINELIERSKVLESYIKKIEKKLKDA